MDKSFRLYTGVLKAWEDDKGDQYVSGTTSSTIVDLQGDEITLAALENMRLSALANMTMFLNHSYSVPEDLFGSVSDARIVKRIDNDPKSDSFGKEVHDLDITMKVSPEDENPRAQKTYRAIQRGRKLGLSIGAMVTKASTRKNATGDEIWVIEGVELRESSVVGIPANQRSYMHNALKALKGIPESTSEAGISRELEEKGMGDKVRAGIIKNEAAAAAVASARVSDLDDVEVVPVAEVIVADDNVSDGFEGLDAITNEVVAAVAEAAPEDDATVTEDEPVVIEAAAGATTRKYNESHGEDGRFAEGGGGADAPATGAVHKVSETADMRTVANKGDTITVNGSGLAARPSSGNDIVTGKVGAVDKSSITVRSYQFGDFLISNSSERDANITFQVSSSKSLAPSVADTSPERAKGFVPDPGDDALGYTYLLESVLSHLSQCDDPEDAAVLQGIATSIQALIASEIAEITAATSVEMASAIPLIQKALDAATTSKREAVDLRKQLTTVTAEKAQVEELLSKALEHLSSALALPVGRKSAVTTVIQAAAPDFPWLAPAVAARVARAS